MAIRIRAAVAALVLAVGVLIGVGGTPSTAAAPVAASAATTVALPGGGYEVDGLDLHDSTVLHLPDGQYAMYGSMYACGYQWYVTNTPWCGFGVSTAPSLSGPWSTPTLLFSPTDTDPWTGQSWQVECGSTGQGCFNPRMIQRDTWGSADGTWILWFNSPIDWSRNHSNAYNAMGCNSPTGPCGPSAGAPHGSYTKPSLSVCNGNGDFGIIQTPSARPAIVCSLASATQLNIEELNYSGVGGDGIGARGVAVTDTEGPGGWWDAASGQYVITYSTPDCGYCGGTGTGYATSSSLYSGWSVPANVGFAAQPNGRRVFTAGSCGGQPRTVTVLDGQPYQIVDLWLGTRNETNANTLITPLSYTPTTAVAGDGQRWIPPVSYPCN